MIGNLTIGQKASLLWAMEGGRFFQTGGLFLLGYLIGRKGWLVESVENKMVWVRVVIISALAYVPMATMASITKGSYAGLVFDMWHKLMFTGVLVSSFTIAYWSLNHFRKICTPLSTYGRMSLSNYLGQSYLGALLFFPFGFNLAAHLGSFASLGVGLGMFIFQILVCQCWFKNYKKGPLESLWHKLTWISFNKRKVVQDQQVKFQ